MRPTILRQGKSVTFMGCDLIADDKLAVRALFAFGGEREADPRPPFAPMPRVAPPSDCPPLWNGPRPGFVRHFDQRLAGGAHPNGGAEQGELLVWARHIDGSGASPLAALVAIGDALPPAAMSRVTRSTIISTMSWHLDIVAPDAFDPARYVLLHSFEDAAAAGYSSQNMAMWSEAGELVALGRQNIAVFG